MLTGRYKLKKGWFNRIYIEIEEKYYDGNDPFDTEMYSAWRKATTDEIIDIITDINNEKSQVIKIFKWLLGYKSFPKRKDGDGLYWWRKELRNKLNKIGVIIK